MESSSEGCPQRVPPESVDDEEKQTQGQELGVRGHVTWRGLADHRGPAAIILFIRRRMNGTVAGLFPARGGPILDGSCLQRHLHDYHLPRGCDDGRARREG